MKIDVAFLPRDIEGRDLSETVCIVLDIFRATTTITTAIANKCRAIFPVLSVEDAHKLREQIGPAFFAGERQSITIPGFDFGNSPYEFSPDKVQGKTIIMTTTNGTVAIKATEGAFRTLIGSFINAQAVCREAQKHGKDVIIVCAGTDRLFSLEDALCAGLMVKLMSETHTEITDAAQSAVLMYNQAQDNLTNVAISSRNGKRLYDLDKMADVEYCFRTDILNTVAEYKDNKITFCKK